MRKKIMAVAVAGALAAPAVAFAQASTVQIYGTIIQNYNILDQGNHRPKTDVMNNHDSGLGFKGEEALGGGLAAWFQCESTLDTTGNASAAGTGQWCGRNSAIGFKGGFGNLYFGVWDAPMKITMANFRPFSTSGAFGMGAVVWNSSASNVSNTVGTNAAFSFTRRQNNSLNYQTPVWSGFQAGIAYSATNDSTGLLTTATANKPRLWSLGAQYSNGPLIVGGGYERHKDYNPAALAAYPGGTDRAWNLGAAYTFGGVFKASAVYSDMNYESSATTRLKQKSWGIYGDWAIQGPHRLRLGYSKAGDTSGTLGTAAAPVSIGSFVGNGGTGGTSANLWALQYAYAFSKRTEGNFGYARLNNSINNKYTLQSLGTGTLGQDQNAWVIGVKHTF